MENIFLASMSALWLGILTSISPCPLATNIAAISFIGRHIEKTKLAFLSGILYTLGRMISYIIIGIIIVKSILTIPFVANFLQKYMNIILGPILIIAGLILLEVIQINFSRVSGLSEKTQSKIKRMGIWGAFLLGVIFALTFCPISAALFFGSLIPLAVKYNSVIFLPSLYGVGTALPVISFAILLAISTQLVAKTFNKITQIEFWARKITAVLFILIGIFLCLRYIFNLI